MRTRLVEMLRCPVCGDTLTPETFQTEPDDDSGEPDWIGEGVLRDTDGLHEYPVILGVPRMLPPGEREGLGKRYPEFFAKHRDRLGTALLDECGGGTEQDRVQGQIIDRFGYEWTEFKAYDSDNFIYWIEPIETQFFGGKLGLDIGCGAGRHSAEAASYGAEMVSIDLSWSVDSAVERSRTIPNMNVVQADVFAPPFAPETFDFIFSLGVLHHTPDPPRAFDSVVPLAREGGAVLVMIYGSQRKWVIRLLAAARFVTNRLPNPVIKAVSHLGGVCDEFFIQPYRALRALGLERMAKAMFPTRIMNYADFSYRDIVTDWFDRLSYPEVHYYDDEQIRDWYESNAFRDILVTPLLNHAYRGLGYRST